MNTTDMADINIGFIGAGNMATALIGGLCKSGIAGERIYISDLNQDKMQPLANTFHVNTCHNNQDVLRNCQVVVLAVKPQAMKSVINQLDISGCDCLFLSIAAGIHIEHLVEWFGSQLALVRAMPNTPALVQSGATAMFANDSVTAEQKTYAEKIMSAVGLALWVNNESELDAVTALSGSGPAYFFYMMEAMEQAGVELGLDSDLVHALTVQTALGSAKLAQSATETPEQLRVRVTSPGGTTEAAINHMQSNNGLAMIKQAVHEAEQRSKELARELK